jgi:hypothetical protein
MVYMKVSKESPLVTHRTLRLKQRGKTNELSSVSELVYLNSVATPLSNHTSKSVHHGLTCCHVNGPIGGRLWT